VGAEVQVKLLRISADEESSEPWAIPDALLIGFTAEVTTEDGDRMSPIRVLFVDDSMLILEALGEVLCSDPEIEIVGTASSGEQALSLLPGLRPSLVMLDLAHCRE
jgi:PleD family two-component response regulator